MAGDFEQWITNSIPLPVISPKTGSVGSFDRWIVSDEMFLSYGELSAVSVSDNSPAYISGAYISLPATETWTGSNGDSWRKSHWATSVV